MKKIILTLSLILILFVIACVKIPDYRSDYVGNWNFKIHESHFEILNPQNNYDTNYYYSGAITKGDISDEIIVKYTSMKSLTLKIDENGTLSNFPINGSSGNFIKTDSLNIYLGPGALGGGTLYTIEGKR